MDSESSPELYSSSKISLDISNGNYPEASKINFTAKEKYYYRSVDKFYRTLSPEKIKLMISIVEGESEISLRLLDWFVTKYADKNIINLKQLSDETDEVNIHISYKAQLKSYRKRYFDPFKRFKKFYYLFTINNETQRFLTTIGQLNFFKWSFKNGIVKYVEDNFTKISESMIQSNKEDKDEKPVKKIIKSKKSDKSSNDNLSKDLPKDSSKDIVVMKKKHTIITAKRIKTPSLSDSSNREKTIIVSFE